MKLCSKQLCLVAGAINRGTVLDIDIPFTLTPVCSYLYSVTQRCSQFSRLAPGNGMK